MAIDTAAAVVDVLHAGEIPLVIGGDCTVTMGVVAGFHDAGQPCALLYFDGGPDLYTPGRTEYGNLDAMGLAHMLSVAGSDAQLTSIWGDAPLLRSDEVVVYGDVIPEDPQDLENIVATQLQLQRVPATRIHQGVAVAARAALTAIEQAGPRFLVHFDVDVLAHMHMPLANMPNPDREPWGLTVEEVIDSLRIFAASDRFAGIVLTEVNPGNAPDQEVLVRYVKMITSGLDRARAAS
ncbi:arginase [Microbacterium murale]|uniref:Arginase n=1 Tax=Microbacterium murale TaxID=1081040 RepID=A0ABU0P534_9MICO|nr:arginase [Microbacterium murale]